MSYESGEEDEVFIDDDLHGIHLDQDELGIRLGRGIPKGSIVLIEGEEGSGRSVISQRLCYGFLCNDCSVTYVSTELTMRDFIDQMYSLNYKIDKYLIGNKLQYFPVFPLIGTTKSRTDFLDKLIKSPILYEKDILFIDTLSSLTNNSMNEAESIRFLEFLKKLVKLDKTIIMAVEASQKGINPIRLTSDIYIALKMRSTRTEISRILQVKRYLRARNQVDEIIRFRIEPRTGLVIEITEVSG